MPEKLRIDVLGYEHAALDRNLWDQIPQPEILTDEQADDWIDLCETNAATYVIAPADRGVEGVDYAGQPMCWIILIVDMRLYRWAIMPASRLYEAMDDMVWLSYLHQTFLVGMGSKATYRPGLPPELPAVARSLSPSEFVAAMQGDADNTREENDDGVLRSDDD